MFCDKCGSPVPVSASFCPQCGNKIQAHQEVTAPKQTDAKVTTSKSILGVPIKHVLLISVVAIIAIVFWIGTSKFSNKKAGWTELTQNGDITIYYDLSSIQKNGNMASMWVLMDYKTGRVDFLSTKSYYTYDCKEGRSKALRIVRYSDNMLHGKVQGDSDPQDSWEGVQPGTISEALWGLACEQLASASTVAEQTAPVKQQSYQEILHGMSDQDLEHELTTAKDALNNALPDKNVSIDVVHQLQQKISEIENEMVSKRSAQMTQHDKDVIAAADSNYNPQSAKWGIIDENDISTTFVDENSIQDMGSSIKRIHALLNFKKPVGKAMSMIDINEFDCENMSARFVKGDSFSDFDGKGTLIGSITPESLGSVPGKFIPIGQDEDSRSLRLQYKFACSGSVMKSEDAATKAKAEANNKAKYEAEIHANAEEVVKDDPEITNIINFINNKTEQSSEQKKKQIKAVMAVAIAWAEPMCCITDDDRVILDKTNQESSQLKDAFFLNSHKKDMHLRNREYCRKEITKMTFPDNLTQCIKILAVD